jgi:ribosomal protein L22
MAEAFEVTALARHIPISAQKVRKVIDVVRGKDADQAMDILRFMPQKAAEPVYKLIESAVANAEQNYGLESDELFVSRIFADEGSYSCLAFSPTRDLGGVYRLMAADLADAAVSSPLCAAHHTFRLCWPSAK